MYLLQRYVFGELARVFTILLIGLTVLLVFVGAVAEATRRGLGLPQILQILPFIVPSLLPFTIPATLLLTVCLVYGRVSGDQEITAIKAAGVSVMVVIWPSFCLGGLLSLATLLLTDQFIPWAQANIELTVAAAMEEIFLSTLEKHNQFSDPQHGITILVQGVKGKKLIKPKIRYRPRNGSSLAISAQEATIQFDMRPKKKLLVIDFVRAHVDSANFNGWSEHHKETFPLPTSKEMAVPRDMTIKDIRREMDEIAQLREQIEQKRILMTVLALSRGNFSQFAAGEFLAYHNLLDHYTGRYNRLNTEMHSRYALACSCMFFVILGSPFSILQSRRQFLTSFMICFLPILTGYYPLMMLCMNLSKTYTAFHPAVTMWVGNVGLLCVGASVLWKVLRY